LAEFTTDFGALYFDIVLAAKRHHAPATTMPAVHPAALKQIPIRSLQPAHSKQLSLSNIFPAAAFTQKVH